MPKILDFKKPKNSLEIRSKANNTAEIIIYGPIGSGFWDDSAVSAKQFNEELKKLDSTVNHIELRLNSPGGDVFDGVAIYNRLKQHKAKVTVYIDGLCASIASIIALAGDEVIMGEGALYMIHLPWTWSYGNRTDFENVINRLQDIEEQMLSIYAKKSKLDKTEIRAMLEKETWLDADQAIEHGFVDKKSEETLAIAASVFDKATWINKAPKNFKSQTKEIQSEITKIKEKVSGYLARK